MVFVRPAQVRTNIIAATFVEVHALRAADVRTVLRARRLKADEENRQKSDTETGDVSPSRVEDPDSYGSMEEQQSRWSKHSSIIRKFVSRQVLFQAPLIVGRSKQVFAAIASQAIFVSSLRGQLLFVVLFRYR